LKALAAFWVIFHRLISFPTIRRILMNNLLRPLICAALTAGFATGLMHSASAQDAVIRKNITERLADFPKIDEISKTTIPGVYELRMGTDVIYTDERGDHLIQGQLIDTKTGLNLTRARVDKLTVIDFASLPLKDAVVWKQGTGARKLAVFADPNCGYCKKLEAELQKVKDVTVYNFLLPILGADSVEKARNIWCTKDNITVWQNWMLRGVAPVRVMGQCDSSALERNVAMAKKYRVNGTPALVFESGRREPGALSAEQIEKELAVPRSGKN
jgi:thiol:disulfide interchange protein DsbC